jgi:hypothetical protein
VHTPRIAWIRVVRRGEVRRSKLYYLRRRVGKATRLREAVGADEAAAAQGASAAERDAGSRSGPPAEGGGKAKAREPAAKA